MEIRFKLKQSWLFINMKRHLSFFIFLILLSNTLRALGTATIDSPQEQMVGARYHSLGWSNPVIMGDINGTFANPATLGEVDAVPLVLSTHTVLNAFQYRYLATALPTYIKLPFSNKKRHAQRITFGFTYGDYELSGVPETVLNPQGRPEEYGSFSSKTALYGFSAGTSIYNRLGLDTLSLGYTLKYIQFNQVQGAGSNGMGLDFGFMGSRFIGWGPLDKVHFGVAAQNFVATSLVNTKTQTKSTVPLDIKVGARTDLFQEKLSLYLFNGIEGFTLAGEYFFLNSVILRGGTDSHRVNGGLGILLDKIAGGSGNNPYSIRFDYNYTQNIAPFKDAPNHVFSVTLLGSSRPKKPQILEPAQDLVVTNATSLPLRGVGPKNTTIQLFNNDNLSRTSLSDRFGKWSFKSFPLKQGLNKISMQAYSLSDENSGQSNSVSIYSDTAPPSVSASVSIQKDSLEILVESNEGLSSIQGKLDSTPIQFQRLSKIFEPTMRPLDRVTNPTEWVARIRLPESLKSGALAPSVLSKLVIDATDIAKNKGKSYELPFFVSVQFPQDKFVHYKPQLRVVGNGSSQVRRIRVNDLPVYMDPSYRFAISVPLKPGKNTVSVVAETLDGTPLSYKLRVLSLTSYPDLNDTVKNRREIEFLSTLGILQGDNDGNFYPAKMVTRGYIAKLMVKSNPEIKVPTTLTSTFPDIPRNHPEALFIQAAVENGLVFAYPDGSFKPDQALTLPEVIFLMSNAGMISYQEASLSNSNYITRRELAEFLAYTPEYELKIESMINWNTGY